MDQAIQERTTLSRITRLVAEQLMQPEENVTPDAKFTDLGADSLDSVELCMALEAEFGVEIPDEEAQKLATPAQAVAWIEAQPSRSKP